MRFIYTKAFGIFAACLVVAVVFLVLQVKGWLDPIRAAALKSPRPVIFLVKSLTLPVKNFFGTIYELHKIVVEDGQLKSKVIGLQQDLVQFNQQQRENQALRKELGFVKNSKEELVPCTVLSQNPFGLADSLIINCGLNDGVSQGQAVISGGFLAGKITYSSKTESAVLLATAADFSTDAKVSQTSATAIVRGSFGSGLILDQVMQSSDLQKGWLAVTAGINRQIPKNILIGEVSDILSSDSDLFKRAALISPVDFNNLEFVFVVK